MKRFSAFTIIALLAPLAHAQAPSADDLVKSAIAKQGKGDNQGAIADLNAAIAANPKSAEAFYRRGLAQRASSVNMDAVIWDMNKAIEINPDYMEAYIERGSAKLFKQNYDDAITDFSKAIEIKPGNAEGYQRRAQAKNFKGDADGAIVDYTKAIEIKPDAMESLVSRAKIRLKKEDFKGVIEDYTKMIAIKPTSDAYIRRGGVRSLLGENDQALEDLNKAVELEPKSAKALGNRAALHFTRQAWKESLADYRSAAALYPEGSFNQQHWVWIARARLGEKDQASVELKASLAAKKPGNSFAETWYASISFFLAGEMKEADFLKFAVESDAKNKSNMEGKAHYYVAVRRLIDGDKAGAIAGFEKAAADAEKAVGLQKFDPEYLNARSELKTLKPGK